MRAITKILRQSPARSFPLNPWDLTTFTFNGNSYTAGLNTTMPNAGIEKVGTEFQQIVRGAYQSNGAVAAVLLARLMPFSQIRFQYQRMRNGRPGDLWGDDRLRVLERPWPGGTTQDLLAKMEQHASLAGNAYVLRRGDRLKVLRPDWVTIVRVSEMEIDNPMDAELAGYIYQPGGSGSGKSPVMFGPNDVAHYAPLPDPIHEHKGQSWLLPVLMDVSAHRAANFHKFQFFNNGATPNLVVKFDPATSKDAVKAFKEIFLDEHSGAGNAYKTAFLGGGADVSVVGQDFKQLDFKRVQGQNETSIAQAGGVPPIIANLSEGLESATYSNYAQAKMHFRDTTVTTLARNVAASLETIVPAPRDSRLWFDVSDIPFFRDDAKSEAEVHQLQVQMMRTLADGGWRPDSAVEAVLSGDWSLLQHTGTFSVQLQPPGEDQPIPEEPTDE